MNTIKHNESLYCCDYSPDGRHFVVAGKDKKVYVYDDQTKELVSTITGGNLNNPGHSNNVFALRFVPNDTNVFLSGGWCKSIIINDIRV